MMLDSLAASPFFDVLLQLLVSDVRIFEKVLLKSIEYYWAQKSITNTSINTCW